MDINMDKYSVSDPNNSPETLTELVGSARPIIAIDLDDVLAQTTRCAAEWHNAEFGTDMVLSSFYYSMWYKCPGWGTVAETLHKIGKFYETDQLKDARPVPGAVEGLMALAELGYDLIVLTARNFDQELESTQLWLGCHFAGIFRSVVFFKQATKSRSISDGMRFVGSSSTKEEICESLGIALLIDDSLETALEFSGKGRRPMLLFGDYEWNKRADSGGQWSFGERWTAECGREWWHEEDVDVETMEGVWRAGTWSQIVSWVRQADALSGRAIEDRLWIA